MKIAASVIDGVCVDCGTNLQQQKAAIKELVNKYGAGDDKVYVLYSSQRPAVRKRIALPKGADPQKLYDEGVKLAKKEDEDRKKAEKAEAEKAAKELAEYKKAKKIRSEAIRTGKKPKPEAKPEK